MNPLSTRGTRPRHPFHALAVVAALSLPLGAAAQTLGYLGQQIVPSGTVYAGTTVGGLSGIDRIAASGRYVAIADDRSQFQPARFYELSLDLSQFQRSGTPGFAGVSFTAVTTIQRPDGSAFPLNTVDPEALRFNPATGTLLWSNEGQRAAAGLQDPTVREMSASGVYLRDFAVPGRFAPTGSVAGTAPGDRGIRNNLAFESLTLSTDGLTLYTATENALVQDGPASSTAAGSPSRIASFNLATGAAGAEWVYEVAPVVLPPAAAGGFTTNGLVELLAIGEREFIAVERSFAVGAATPGVGPNGLPTGNTIRLFHVDARNATDVSGLDSLIAASYTPVTKTLLADLSDFRNDDGSALALDNIEGLTLGPMVGGKQTLILVSDNNFGAAQFTQFIALEITPVPEPATWALWLGGLAALQALRRCR
ncbi:MAG: esterase-like activity of phytase family protein [Rubrivivax sp.]|nr:esterase-like activity of phytase family protein [Rubrivivax sp.]